MIMLLRLTLYSIFCSDHHAVPHSTLPELISSTLEIIQGQIYHKGRSVSKPDQISNSQVPVRHVVFMVHGIGQRLEKANLVDDVGTFRQTVSALAEQHLTTHQRNAQRILFIPCQV